MSGNSHVKILFRLNRDEDGYPPIEWEALWAKDLGGGLFELDNIPFYVRGLSCGDIVSATLAASGEWLFDALVKASRNSTLRILAVDMEAAIQVKKWMGAQGAECESSNIATFISVHIPLNVDLEPILAYVRNAESEGKLDYEEAALRHS